MGYTMGVVNQIQANYESMTTIQRKIADYIVKNSSAVAFMTLEKLAAEVGSSTASIIRFSRFLNLGGYADFVQELRKELLQKDSVPQRLYKNRKRQQNSTLLQSNLNNTVNNIQLTSSHIDALGCGPVAARLLTEAKRIFVYGTCSMTGVAQYMTASLRMNHNNVNQLMGVGGIFADEFLSLGEGDAIVIFLFPRYEFLLLKLLPILRKKQVKIIVFTTLIYDSISPLGDVFIPCSVAGLSIRDSLTSIMFAVDYIASEVSARTGYDIQERYAENMEEMVSTFYVGI